VVQLQRMCTNLCIAFNKRKRLSHKKKEKKKKTEFVNNQRNPQTKKKIKIKNYNCEYHKYYDIIEFSIDKSS